jgi:16S rRNA (adenine1518-N6/adenine1519-N6)-dimethyltransferase
MVQREVADRMIANPGGKDYGALSVAVQYRSVPKRVFDVPPHCFIPQPDVYSTVVRLDLRKSDFVEVMDEKLFFRVVKAAFGQRRKTLANALFNSGFFMLTKDEISELMKSIGIDPGRRGETLSIMQFSELANALYFKKP